MTKVYFSPYVDDQKEVTSHSDSRIILPFISSIMISKSTYEAKRLKLEQTVALLESYLDNLESRPDLSKEIFNLHEAAVFLGLTKSQLYKLTHLRMIPFYKPTGKLVVFVRQELIDWVKASRSATTEEVDALALSHLQTLAAC